MPLMRRLLCILLVVASHGARAQLAIPAGIDLFAKNPDVTGESAKQTDDDKAYPHALLFHQGTQLRGRVSALTKTEVVLERPDADQPVRVPRGEVRRIVLSEPPENNTPLFFQVQSIRREEGFGSKRLLVATVKLVGGGWFCGQLSSADGETFSLALPEQGTLTFHRSQIEWFYFDMKPVPAIELSGNPLDAAGWLTRAPSARVQMSGRTLVVEDAESFSQLAFLPPRFRVQFEVPGDAQEGLRLWLQPTQELPGNRNRGSIELQLARKELSLGRFVEKFEKAIVPIPEEMTRAVNYEVLYDGPGLRLILLRDATVIGEWPLFPSGTDNRPSPIQFLGFDRVLEHEKAPLKFNRLRVEPWNGIVPSGSATTDDQLSAGRYPAIEGKLSRLKETSLLFAEKKAAVAPEVFVQFAPANPVASPDATTRLLLGFAGELNAAELEIRENRAFCKTAFSSGFELPVEPLQIITFSEPATSSKAGPNLLLFKNGDQLTGTLLPSRAEGAIHWRSDSGQQIAFDQSRVAGVRFNGVPDSKPGGINIELRNGDRLRGELLALDKESLTMDHPQLGRLALQRDRLRLIYPDRHLNLSDGMGEAAAWIAGTRRVDNIALHDFVPLKKRDDRWIRSNGFHLLRPGESPAANVPLGDHIPNFLEELQAPAREPLERFEIRAHLSNAAGRDLFSFLFLTAEPGVPFLMATFTPDQLQVGIVDPKNPEANQQQEVSLQEKLSERTGSQQVRIFVNAKLGTADFYINGVLLLRHGQQPRDRVPGLGRTISFATFPIPMAIFSHLWIGPWNGLLPQPETDTAPGTILINGDVASEPAVGFQNGRFLLESEIGPIEVVREKVQLIHFGGAPLPEPRPVACVVLTNGSSLQLSSFSWENGELAAKNVFLGDLRLPAAIIAELIYSPSLIETPVVLPEKKPGRKTLR